MPKEYTHHLHKPIREKQRERLRTGAIGCEHGGKTCCRNLVEKLCIGCGTHGLRMSINEQSPGAAVTITALSLIPQRGLDACEGGRERAVLS